ncbi:hypothetical protein C5Y96_13070 [Blastopirellula marina]|uniref:Transmembrane protein n=1 Tax=Blastopirellula marina TaxID=124 RepID=A0A2S8FGP8_9BACT|nr:MULTISPECIES: hypothetical protein [Pirellulaceae]PQO31270.1 hypothetical protein C5Y96_13070 [Blastopirellula marina]RCS51664.1 hypothetical protein DTL36_13080 [Bremerella cremea]
MTDTSSPESPFASPAIVDESDLPGALEPRTHQALSCMKWLDILVVLHCITIILSPLIVALPATAWLQPAWVFGAMFLWWVASLYVLTVYLVFRSAIIVQMNVLPTIACTLLSLCPCITLFAIFMTSEATRRFLFRQGIPFRGHRPDWKAIREMAAKLPLEDESPATESTS